MARPAVYGGKRVSVSGGPRPQPAGILAWRWGCPWTVTSLAGKLRLDGVQDTSKCNSQPLFKRPPEKRAQSLAQFLIVRVILSIAGDRSLHQKDPSPPARASRRLAQGHPEAAAPSCPLGSRLLACLVCLGVGRGPARRHQRAVWEVSLASLPPWWPVSGIQEP